MAKNDVILLDGIIDQRLSEGYPSCRRDEVFEFFAFEQTLKDFDLSFDEIDFGWVDGRDDGGVDGFFIFVNGNLLLEIEDFVWPRRNAEILVYVITCKSHETFQQAPLNALLASIQELFDLGIELDNLCGAYSDELLDARKRLHQAYRRLSAVNPSFTIRFAYVSRGDSNAVAENVRARSEQIVALTKTLFSACKAQFDFLGAAELISLYRRIKSFSLSLRFLEILSLERASYVLLTQIEDYCRFVTDESGAIRRYLFDSNVRDYLGSTGVNEDILISLADPTAPDFWWLNNGVTMLASHAFIDGKELHIEDIQIVNGLQTTESVYKHFQTLGSQSYNRSLLVKVLVSSDATVRDRIIRATNNQTPVELASLRATDKIQRDIEEILERHGWFYERRKNYYRNIGKPSTRFVTPMYLASGMVALLMKNPAKAARLRARFMRSDETYVQVFSDSIPLQAWVSIVEVIKRTEEGLERVRPDEERFLAKWRSLVALVSVSRIFQTFTFTSQNLIQLDVKALIPELIEETWALIQSQRSEKPKSKDFRSPELVRKCCQTAASTYGIALPQVVGRRTIDDNLPPKGKTLPEEFLKAVDAVLPEQPWKPGVHAEIATHLGCKPYKVSQAIRQLVDSGRRYHQKDGVVYDADGKVLMVDSSREI
ncbi:AIPR family protein [Trichocoleus sp. DQ-A3]|uniref:AIPR family protein n=1 Tax=Cyanophyceae TaxID=3028117 RepID=UPI00168498BB|nr:AIPR family protein [Coleofasciculus sp. FACHB-125]MBD1900841.1 AIPR family protein [Coleofasciculus sp. FACHB-125]